MALTKPYVDGREVEAVRRVLESGWLTEGSVTAELERKVAEYVGSKYAVAVCNCTVAIELCLKAYNVKGDVLIPDFTHPATAQAVINASCNPILSDVDLETYNMHGNIHNWANTSIPVSWGGNPFWSCHKSTIIEDGACSLGAEFMGKKTGQTFTTCFSFHPRKLITCGEGGIVTTNDEKIAERIRELKRFGVGGGNYKLNDISSAIVLLQLDKIDKIVDERIEMAKVYGELLDDVRGVVAPHVHPDAKHTYQTYAVYLERDDRDQIIVKLAERGIETQIGTYALHELDAFKHLKRIGPLTNSSKLYHRLLALPMAYDLTVEDQQCVVEALKKEVI